MKRHINFRVGQSDLLDPLCPTPLSSQRNLAKSQGGSVVRLKVAFIGMGNLLVSLAVAAVTTPPPAWAEVAISHNTSEEARQVPTLQLREDLSIGAYSEEEGPTLGRIGDITVSPNGEIYVLDMGFYRVQVFSASGSPLRTISKKGEGPGEISNPSAIALGSHDLLYISDGSRIKIFTPSGEYVEEFLASEATGNIRGMAVDTDGSLYVSSCNLIEQKLVHKYGPDHKWIMSFCDSFAVGQDIDVRVERFAAGGSIGLTSDGNLLFAQKHPYEIRLFTPSGELKRQVFRETDFVRLPGVEITDDGITYTDRGGCYGIVSLPSGAFLCTAMKQRTGEEGGDTLVDCFSPEGRLLASHRWPDRFIIKCADGRGRVYAAHLVGEYPRVVRYIANW